MPQKLYVDLRRVLARQPGAEAVEQLQVYEQTLKYGAGHRRWQGGADLIGHCVHVQGEAQQVPADSSGVEDVPGTRCGGRGGQLPLTWLAVGIAQARVEEYQFDLDKLNNDLRLLKLEYFCEWSHTLLPWLVALTLVWSVHSKAKGRRKAPEDR